MDLGLQGRRAVVCAASSGLGLACAEALAGEGVEVTIVGRDPARLEAAARQIAGARAAVKTVVADLSDPRVCGELPRRTGVPDILVTNGGGPPVRHDATGIDGESWEAAMSSLFHGPVALIGACVGEMRVRGFGRIVNISSAAVLSPRSGFALSVSPRAALIAFCDLLAREVAPHGVTVNHLLPHSIETQRLRDNLAAEAANLGIGADELRARRVASIPVQRPGRPQELGAFCAFLCGAQAGYVTGRKHVIDGGTYI
ncbi:MAG: hypothetical protein ABS43_24955 [Bordetella sp. SCN 67-23]|nr:SDR family oxidoreductase [Burkholderiales bacterium]ODS69680.1 MAG: hypothetical protein ABS43_24955 [Bordetella sp. SCN 67-23]ODU97617.1 MAG: hypothetical protein ABT00_00395 [Bordetella sp. SCN 68-11]OJW86050.1 MAG: hypothetical protein BGO71_12085 [Burkholderiales bacterium 67-32]